MTDSLLTAIALMLVLEGILPFLSPQSFRQIYIKMLESNNNHIRITGLSSMLFGLVMLYMVH